MEKELVRPGESCHPGPRKGNTRGPHVIVEPGDDAEFQAVLAWLQTNDAPINLKAAVDDAIRYVLDGARTWRFDLTSPDVDSDERASVGTKLQYHVIEKLGLRKEPPLDTTIVGLPVEIKGTVRANWMIPREGQCEITLLIQTDASRHRFRAFLMRTHRAWLNDGKNQDGKLSVQAKARDEFAYPLVEWTDLPPEPLRMLTQEQLQVVFGGEGQTKRLTALFGYLPEVVIPRTSIETVGATNKDVMRRARQAKEPVLEKHGLVVLVGTWLEERVLAQQLGHDLGDSSWVAVPEAKVRALGIDPVAFLRGTGRPNRADYRGRDIFRRVVFPKPEDGPASSLEGVRGLAVPGNVPAYLHGPVVGVRLRRTAVLAAPMPEAPVYEHGDFCPCEHEVGFPSSHLGQRGVVDPVPKTRSVDQSAHRHLRSGIPPAISAHRLADGRRRRPTEVRARLIHTPIFRW